MKPWILITLAFVPSFAFCSAKEDYDAAIANYAKAKEAALRPVNRRHIETLEAVQKKALNENNPELAIKVREEIKSLDTTGGSTPSSDVAKNAKPLVKFAGKIYEGSGSRIKVTAEGLDTGKWGFHKCKGKSPDKPDVYLLEHEPEKIYEYLITDKKVKRLTDGMEWNR